MGKVVPAASERNYSIALSGWKNMLQMKVGFEPWNISRCARGMTDICKHLLPDLYITTDLELEEASLDKSWVIMKKFPRGLLDVING